MMERPSGQQLPAPARGKKEVAAPAADRPPPNWDTLKDGPWRGAGDDKMDPPVYPAVQMAPVERQNWLQSGDGDTIRESDRNKELAKKNERVPLHLNLPVGLAHMAWAMWDGFKKYGFASWRKLEVKVTALSMIGAAERHLQLLKDGQDYAADSNAHHAGHVMACMQIYLDCEASKKVGFDDRVPGPAPAVWPCQKVV